jgi:uncharacterized repeat protein (TIGR01451 family)
VSNQLGMILLRSGETIGSKTVAISLKYLLWKIGIAAAGISSTFVLSALPALAGTNVSSTASVLVTGEAIGYTVDAVSLSRSFNTNTCTLTPTRDFKITLPAGATVNKAILYWATDLSAGDSQVSLAGTPINATKSWNDTILTTTQTYNGYRADVTSQITGTGTYTFGGLSSAATSPFLGGCLSGATLVTIYNTTRSDPNALNRIEMFDGFQGIRGAGLGSGGVSSTVTLPINSLGIDLSFMTALSWQGNSANEVPIGSNYNYNDNLTVNGTKVSNSNNPITDNGNGSGANKAPDSTYAVDADTFDISSIVKNIASGTPLTIANTSVDSDYVIAQGFIVGSRGADISDAPNSGGFSYGIARHKIVPTLANPSLYLGSTVDGEVVDNTYAGSINADFDDTNGVNDDDGVTFSPLSSGVTSYSIPASNITAHGSGTLHAWIDFNKNGTFDPGEHTSVIVTNNVLAGALNWTGITAGSAGNTYARFRFTTDTTVTASTPSGLAADGEVEDYKIAIGVTITGNIFADANGNKIQNSPAESGTNAGGLNAVLVNSLNKVVATTPVASDGTYTFSAVSASVNPYTIRISTATATVNLAPPAIVLPTNWVSTGENLGGAADSIVDSILAVTVGTSNITGANFGIRQNPADVLLLKRITAINGLSINPNDNKSLTGVLVDPNWKVGYVVGATDGGKVKPGDTIEYTIYYLNNGGRNAKSARICDRLNSNQSFQPNTYTTGAGMQVQIGGDRITNSAVNLTNQSGDDGGQFIAATSPVTALPTDCKSITGAPNNDYGALILDLVTSPGSPNLTTLPGKTSQGTPNESFGFWRFITKVNQVSP